jgi:hypothetical protein
MTWLKDPRTKLYAERYKLNRRVAGKLAYGAMLLNQLDACADESARRLLLGVSRKTGVRKQGLGEAGGRHEL